MKLPAEWPYCFYHTHQKFIHSFIHSFRDHVKRREFYRMCDELKTVDIAPSATMATLDFVEAANSPRKQFLGMDKYFVKFLECWEPCT